MHTSRQASLRFLWFLLEIHHLFFSWFLDVLSVKTSIVAETHQPQTFPVCPLDKVGFGDIDPQSQTFSKAPTSL